MKNQNGMKEMAQLEPPALLGRRQRVADFKQFIEANRKQLKASVIVAQYSINSGVSQRTVNSYLKLFYEAGVYHMPTSYSDWKLLTPSEYEEVKEQKEAEWKAKEAERQKELEAELFKRDAYEEEDWEDEDD